MAETDSHLTSKGDPPFAGPPDATEPTIPSPECVVLFHQALNPSGRATVVLLHGLGSSHREWSPVAAILAQHYHLLIPDLPAHCQSRSVQPFTLANAAAHVAALIRQCAHESVCHLVGFSAGGYTALTVAEKYPELLQSVFVSGVYDMAKSHWGPLVKFAPYINVPFTKLQGLVPRSWFDYVSGKMGLKFPDGLLEDTLINNSVGLSKAGFKTVVAFGGGVPVRTRVCVVAGGSQDDVKGTKELAKRLRSGIGNAETKAAVVRGAMHWWSLQREDLFAAAVRAWIEHEDLPKELESLDEAGTPASPVAMST